MKTWTEIKDMLQGEDRIEIKPGSIHLDIAKRSFLRLPTEKEVEERMKAPNATENSHLFLISERILENGLAAYFGKTAYQVVLSRFDKYRWSTGTENKVEILGKFDKNEFTKVLLEYYQVEKIDHLT